MKSLYLRIYLTVVVALALFAIGSTWLFQRQVEMERGRLDAQISERVGAWADLIQRSLPGPEASPGEQADALREWSQRLRLPLALDDATGGRIAASDSFLRRQSEGTGRALPVALDDGRTLWVMRPGLRQAARAMGPDGAPGRIGPPGARPGEPPPLKSASVHRLPSARSGRADPARAPRVVGARMTRKRKV